mmetsp:Transcript_38426/g.44743  ORF Transcript_38426/g.44743 Transcript_38426/m.44743 type:complete len:462 (+) Transcript_38426:59-1444(+)
MTSSAGSGRWIALLDRVHEHVALPPIVVRAMDTPQVQRLRGLKQLGASSFLYPGAVHTRFEHSIGVAHMARSFLTIIQTKQPDLGLSPRNVENVMLAGLLHDLGHGPFSHLFEDVISNNAVSKTPFCHEAMSRLLAERVLNTIGVKDQDTNEVLSLMAGASTNVLPHGSLISNKRNGVDVDRLDYFLRDSLCCFGKPTVDVRAQRLFHTARIMRTDDDKEWVIAFEEKMAIALRELFALRAKLHKQVYQHQVTKAIGHMIGDAIRLAEPHFSIAGRTFREASSDPDAFVALGDWIFEAIEFSRDPLLAPAQEIIHRLRRRDLYRLSCCTVLQTNVKISGREVIEKLLSLASDAVAPRIQRDIIVDVVTINHGQGPRDPLRNVPFFNPKSHTPSISWITEGSSPLFCPQVFEERTIMIFQRRPDVDVRAVVNSWMSWASEEGLTAPHVPFFNATPHAHQSQS